MGPAKNTLTCRVAVVIGIVVLEAGSNPLCKSRSFNGSLSPPPPPSRDSVVHSFAPSPTAINSPRAQLAPPSITSVAPLTWDPALLHR